MIVGNVENYIDRCLHSFLPIADEVCLVRAIGNQEPDGTFAKAENACREWFHGRKQQLPDGFLKLEVYHNKPGHEDWPHVDDFAAARQWSFDIATGEYCFWCDSDDMLESGAEHVRALADRGGYACYVFPYRIFGKGLMVPRERMMLRDSGRWKFPVHECYEFKIAPTSAVEDQRVIITHMPNLPKSVSMDRNLRILKSIPQEEMTTGLWYHLHLELALAKDIPGSVEAAQRALSAPDIGRPEKYDLYLNLAQVAETDDQKLTLYQAAYGADPRRREALLLLTNHALNCGRPDDALAYARQMRATVVPYDLAWNHRAAVYDWVGEDLYAQALRASGKMIEAEAIRIEALKRAGGPRIALIHATRGRYEQAALCRKLWLDMADRPDQVEHIFVIDQDDDKSWPLRRMNHAVLPPGGGCVAAWNYGAFLTQAPVVIQLSDDWEPPAQWDKLILQRIGDVEKPAVLAVSDDVRTDQLLCIAIMTRQYLCQDYFMFHPWFTGVYSDNWFTELAYRRGAVIEARDLRFIHKHPVKTGAPLDETYRKQNAPERYAEGAAIIADLRLKKDWASVPGFCNFWTFYELIASQLKDGDTVCEVGVWMGRSIIYMAQQLKRLKKKVRLIAVDTFKGELGQAAHQDIVKAHGGSLRAVFEANVKRCEVEDMIEIVEGDSAASASKVKDGSLAFCFIDAAHDYESVKRDILAWKPKVKHGGVLAGHDAQHEDVAKAVRELIPDATFMTFIWTKKL